MSRENQLHSVSWILRRRGAGLKSTAIFHDLDEHRIVSVQFFKLSIWRPAPRLKL